jgi:hypothetical protein
MTQFLKHFLPPKTLKERVLLIFHPFWVIQTGMGALSTYEDFILKPYVERRRFEWERGDWDSKCSVTSLFTLLVVYSCMNNIFSWILHPLGYLR